MRWTFCNNFSQIFMNCEINTKLNLRPYFQKFQNKKKIDLRVKMCFPIGVKIDLRAEQILQKRIYEFHKNNVWRLCTFSLT